MSAGAGRLPRLLPPLARGREWLAGGVGAGLSLGAAECLALYAQGVELAPSRALGIVALDAAAVATLSLPVAVVTALARKRVRHSTVAGGVLGPLLLAPVLPRLFLLDLASPGEDLIPPGLISVVGLALVGGSLAGEAGSRLERAGIPISGPPLWIAVALLVAAAAAFRDGRGVAPRPEISIALVALVVILALLAAVLSVVGARRAAVVPWPWGKTLLALAALAAGAALAPRLMPWLLMDPPSVAPLARAPDVLLIDLGEFPAGGAPGVGDAARAQGDPVAPNLTLLAAAGSLYRQVVPPSGETAAFDWLRLSDGLPLARVLRAQGYLARLAGAGDGLRLPPGFDRADARKSDEREAAVRATVGGGLLWALGVDAARPPRSESESARITAEAQRRIAAAQAFDRTRPLLLFVDYASAERSAARLDDSVGAIADFLADLGLEETTRLVVAWREVESAQSVALRVLLRPEPSDLHAPRGTVIDAPVLAATIAARAAGQAAPTTDRP